MLRLLPLVFLALLLSACASAGDVESEGTPARSTQVITQEELATLDVATAYQVVQRLRPGWLRGLGPLRNLSVLESVPAGVLEGGDSRTFTSLIEI